MKALKILKEKNKILKDCIILIDAMYLQEKHYQDGERVGSNAEERL